MNNHDRKLMGGRKFNAVRRNFAVRRDFIVRGDLTLRQEVSFLAFIRKQGGAVHFQDTGHLTSGYNFTAALNHEIILLEK